MRANDSDSHAHDAVGEKVSIETNATRPRSDNYRPAKPAIQKAKLVVQSE
jgi:hypothetical protein